MDIYICVGVRCTYVYVEAARSCFSKEVWEGAPLCCLGTHSMDV